MHEQLLLFEDEPHVRLQREINLLNNKYDRLRKSQFSRIGELEKMYKETKSELDFIKSAICKSHVELLEPEQMRLFK
jgi:hypothetical protein